MSAASPSKPPPRLLDLVRQQTRLLHYSLRTEEAYVHWVRAFVRYHGLRHPSELAGPDITAFLTWLAHDRQAAPGTHRQALSALLFLYQKVLRQPVPWVDEIGHPKGERRLPVVMSVDEVAAVLARLDVNPLGGQHAPVGLVGRLLYGTGMRLLEGLRLRVKDVDFDRRALIVREGKGFKDRVVMLPLRSNCRCATSSRAATPFGGTIAPPAWPACTCRTRWRASTRALPGPGAGSGCSRTPRCRSIRAPTSADATTSWRARSSAPSSRRWMTQASPSRPRRTRCAIRSPPICCSRATTSARSRNCSATPT